MSVSGTQGTSGTSGTGSDYQPSPPASTSSTAITKNMFLQLLVAQMKNQDPLKPTDSSAFVGQLAQCLRQFFVPRNVIDRFHQRATEENCPGTVGDPC